MLYNVSCYESSVNWAAIPAARELLPGFDAKPWQSQVSAIKGEIARLFSPLRSLIREDFSRKIIIELGIVLFWSN